MSLDTAEPISSQLTPLVESTQPVLDDEILERFERLGASVGEDLLGQLIVLFLADADTHVIDLRRAGLETAGPVGDLAAGALLLEAMEIELGQVREALNLRIPTT